MIYKEVPRIPHKGRDGRKGASVLVWYPVSMVGCRPLSTEYEEEVISDDKKLI